MKPTLTNADFQAAAAELGCSVAAIKAVCEVESPKGGFNPDGSPTTLFEAHIFSRYTGGKYDRTRPNLSSRTWNRKLYEPTWQAEKTRLDAAVKLDRTAALMSASWGRFQIMGFNFPLCGCKTVQAFVNAMYASEQQQLAAFVAFVKNRGLDDELRNGEVRAFVRGYNGPGQVDHYAPRLIAAFEKHGGTNWIA